MYTGRVFWVSGLELANLLPEPNMFEFDWVGLDPNNKKCLNQLARLGLGFEFIGLTRTHKHP